MLSKKALCPPKTPSEEFASIFSAAAKQFSAEFLKSKVYNHALSKGEAREEVVRDFFRTRLPGGFEVVGGEVVDPHGIHSPQLDLMIYDRLRNVPIYSDETSSAVLPAEALIASVEVKSTLTKKDLVKSLKAAEKLRALRPFKRPLLSGDRGGDSRRDQCRYFHVVFAYSSDIGETDWLAKEDARLRDVATDLAISEDVLDRIYVAERGLLHPATRRGIREEPGEAIGLMNLFMHTLNFVIRENDNRKPVPYSQYSGTLSQGWQDLS